MIIWCSADMQTLLSCLQICKNNMILQWLHIHFPSWLAPSVSICHRLLCPIIWLALNTPALRELSCVLPWRVIHKQSHYNMYSHISNNKTDGHCARRLICFPHEWWEKKKYFVWAVFNADCFIPKEEQLAVALLDQLLWKTILFSLISLQQRHLLGRFRITAGKASG